MKSSPIRHKITRWSFAIRKNVKRKPLSQTKENKMKYFIGKVCSEPREVFTILQGNSLLHSEVPHVQCASNVFHHRCFFPTLTTFVAQVWMSFDYTEKMSWLQRHDSSVISTNNQQKTALVSAIFFFTSKHARCKCLRICVSNSNRLLVIVVKEYLWWNELHEQSDEVEEGGKKLIHFLVVGCVLCETFQSTAMTRRARLCWSRQLFFSSFPRNEILSSSLSADHHRTVMDSFPSSTFSLLRISPLSSSRELSCEWIYVGKVQKEWAKIWCLNFFYDRLTRLQVKRMSCGHIFLFLHDGRWSSRISMRWKFRIFLLFWPLRWVFGKMFTQSWSSIFTSFVTRNFSRFRCFSFFSSFKWTIKCANNLRRWYEKSSQEGNTRNGEENEIRSKFRIIICWLVNVSVSRLISFHIHSVWAVWLSWGIISNSWTTTKK